MPKKMGRPPVPKNEARIEFVGARLQSSEAREIRDAIRKSGQAKSEWIRDALLSAARRASGRWPRVEKRTSFLDQLHQHAGWTPLLTAGVVFNHGFETSRDEDSLFFAATVGADAGARGRMRCEFGSGFLRLEQTPHSGPRRSVGRASEK